MYRKKSMAVFACLCMAMAFGLIGCGNKNTSQSSTSAEVGTKESNQLMGSIEAIDGTSITVSVFGGGMPPGEMPEGGTPPEKPAGEQPQGDAQPGQMPQAESKTYTVADSAVIKDAEGATKTLVDLKVGDFVMITLDEQGDIATIALATAPQMQAGQGNAPQMPPGGGATKVENYDAVSEFSADATESGKTYTSTGKDENAILVSEGAQVSLTDVTVTRESADSTGGDTSSFYGVGATLLATDGTLNIDGGTITTNAAGGAGVFAYDKGVVNISNVTIRTEQDTSGGIHVAGGGMLNAKNLDVETNGESAAAIRSDRGGGTMDVEGGTYVSNGVGSPAVYCTANISVEDATLTANGSEGVCIEGKNSLELDNCNLTSNMSDDNQNDCTWSVILYQSMSGDSEVGESKFSMEGGSITSKNGGIFYTTNTACTFELSEVDIQAAEDSEFFLRCTGNANKRGWGTSGNNGSQCKFYAEEQMMNGDIIYDSISTLDLFMEDGSVLNGAIVKDDSFAGNGGNGYCNVSISDDAKWVLTGDSELTTLSNAGAICDENGKTVTIVGVDGTVYVDGDSQYTVTVSNYTTLENDD